MQEALRRRCQSAAGEACGMAERTACALQRVLHTATPPLGSTHSNTCSVVLRRSAVASAVAPSDDMLLSASLCECTGDVRTWNVRTHI